MAFLGFMTVREHDRIVARADAVIDSATFHLAGEEYNEGRTLPQKVAIAVKRLAEARSNAFKNRQRYLTVEAKLRELAAELATLKVERERRLAPLAAANAARKAKAQAARGGDVREGL